MLTLAIVSIFTILLTIFLLSLQKVTKPSAGLPVVKNIEERASKVSIIVPMRNEERNVKQCIESLLFQNYPNFEIIAVDDRSKDNTLNMLKEFASKHANLRVIEGDSVPEGWVGKNYAIWQAVKWAQGDWCGSRAPDPGRN